MTNPAQSPFTVNSMDISHHVVIIGGGFGGLFAARALQAAPARITLIDRQNFHLFVPLLYQVATGGLSAANIAAPLRELLKQQPNTETVLGEVTDIDPVQRQVILANGDTVAYDSLIVASGSETSYFSHAAWQKDAPGLKSVADAELIRRRVLMAFESAEATEDPKLRRSYLTFVVVGGGPTGVELSGCLAELAHHTLKGDFRHIDPASARVMLVETGERVLAPYSPVLAGKAAATLKKLGVEIHSGATVTEVQSDEVVIQYHDRVERVGTYNVLWAAGVRASPLGELLAHKIGAAIDKSGRVHVTTNLSLPQHPELFIIGDLAHCSGEKGKPLPGVAPVAMQQGRYVAQVIYSRLRGKTLPPFQYSDHGSMTVIGRNAAVAEIGHLQISGFPAWMLWVFVHLAYLCPFQNRALVLLQWMWNYITRNRSALLIPDPGATEFTPRVPAAAECIETVNN